MEELTLGELSTSSVAEPSQEEKCLINALVRSGFTQLTSLDLSDNPSWFAHIEASSHLFEFIQEQTCLK